MTFPFLTTYDPPGSSEGTLDPLGLYQIADQLGIMLVPAVRERMQRIRFLTAIAVGSIVTEGLEDNPKYRDASPYLVWEWLLAESMVRCEDKVSDIDGVPGTLVTRRAIRQHGYLDTRSYLKTPRIFGFFGVYKRLAIHTKVVDVHLAPGPLAEGLVDAWARDRGLGGIKGAQPMINCWRDMVSASLSQKPPRTKVPNSKAWLNLAQAFAPATATARERKFIRNVLHDQNDRKLGSLLPIWKVISEHTEDNIEEEKVHRDLARDDRSLAPLIRAIQDYEIFARSMQDAFDILRAVASTKDTGGFTITDATSDENFVNPVTNLQTKACAARDRLMELGGPSAPLCDLFDQRFGCFMELLSPSDCAIALCSHHEAVQRNKSVEGKRPWFDRLGEDRIYMRHAYRTGRRENLPGHYLHGYRAHPIHRFFRDLS